MPINRDDVVLGNVVKDGVDPWWPDSTIRRLARPEEQKKEQLLPEENPEHKDQEPSLE